jgi:myo-inositol 2-dehydrogenase / D-chiro-inositol 1-dehydrogenase
MAHGHETSTEVIGTAGKLTVGEHAANNRVIHSDQHGVRHGVVKDFYERFEAAFGAEMAAFVAACRGEQALTLTLTDALEATRIGLAITRSLHSGLPERV